MVTKLRTRLLVTTVLTLMLAPTIALMPAPALAACTVVGTGTIGALNSGDVATCTGVGNTDHINATGSSNATVNVGDGTTTSLTPGAGIPAITFDGTIASHVTVNNQATVSTYSGMLLLSNGSNSNTVTIAAGGIAEGTGNAEAAIVIDNSSNNLINIRGTAVGTGANTTGLRISGTSNANVVTVYEGGSIGGDHTGVQFAAGGNTLINAGTISGGFLIAIQGSSGSDTILSSGTISGGGSGAIDLSGGDDSLTLAPGSTITGTVRGGTGTDTLNFGGIGNASFDLSNIGAALQYDGFEQLKKTGSSVWTLTGTTAFSGTTTVDAGGLLVNGTLPSVVAVNGGYLGGTGTVGGLAVNSGGTVAPGSSIGTLNVNGNVAFNTGSTFEVEINAAGQSDRIAATGTATLNGGTVQIVPLGTGFIANTQYTILTATGGVSGSFASLTTSGSPLVSGQLSYDVNNVYFILQQIGGFGTLSGLTPNQAAVAGALDQAQLGGASETLTTAINTLAALDASGIKAGLDDLAGQVHADGRRFVADQADMFQTFMWNAGTQSRGAPCACRPPPTPRSRRIRSARLSPAGAPRRRGTSGSAATAIGTRRRRAALPSERTRPLPAQRSAPISGTCLASRQALRSAHRPASCGWPAAPTGSTLMPAMWASTRAARGAASISHPPSAIPSRRSNPLARSRSSAKLRPPPRGRTPLPPRSVSHAPLRSDGGSRRSRSPRPTGTRHGKAVCPKRGHRA
ncbi:hypothetical protein A1D31_28845 [Bradyrhizobium liaoningense]|nr:hypothetical protein A1D31_28845 [Bradyrhizobium liaoningense]